MTDNIDKLHLIAKYLIERETLEAVELEKLMKDGTLDDLDKVKANDEDNQLKKSVDILVDDETNKQESTEPKVVYITRNFNKL